MDFSSSLTDCFEETCHKYSILFLSSQFTVPYSEFIFPFLSFPRSCLHILAPLLLSPDHFPPLPNLHSALLKTLSLKPHLTKPPSSLHKSFPCPHFPEQPSSASSCICLVLFRVEPWMALICVCKAPCKLTALQNRVSFLISELDRGTTLRIIKIFTLKAVQAPYTKETTVQILV